MKKRIFSRVLALFMALSLLSATALADVSFDDLQSVIDGTSQGTQIEGSDNLGHFWQNPGEGTEGTGYWGIESSKTDGATNITLNTDVTHTENDKTNTITIGAGQDVNLDLNDNNITGTAGSDVIDVKGDLTITGGKDEGKNVISGGATGIDVEQGGKLALDSVTVTNNDIGVSFFDDLSVTFIGDQNVVSGNKTKQIAGEGKVTVELGEKTYKVNANTAEVLLTEPVKTSENWLLVRNSTGTSYTIVYTAEDLPWYKVQAVITDAAKSVGCAESEITGFVIPEGITEIGKGVFKNCSNLTFVSIPETVTKICDQAFMNCKGLVGKLELPANLTAIGGSAFIYCEALTGVTVPKSVTTIGAHAFEGCTGLMEVKLNGKVNLIDVGAFKDCSSLNSINIPETVTKICHNAFVNCTSLDNLVLPKQLETLEKNAFKGCSGLTKSIEIPSGLKEIGVEAFSGCGNLTSIVFPKDSQCSKIAQSAFLWCESLTEVTIPDSVTTIGPHAFNHCTSLKDIRLNEKITVIDVGTFKDCWALESIEIPKSVTTISRFAFENCESLKTVTIPTSVTTIEKAFDAGVEKDVFAGSGIKSIWIPSEEGSKETAKLVASKTDVNIFIEDGSENLSFYRSNVTADFGHNVGEEVNLDDGSVALTNVSGTITAGDETVTLPNVAGITASIDTDGKITLYVPSAITVGGEEYPDGAIVTVDPNGNISARERPSDDPPVISFDFDAITADTSTTIEDEEVPLAGLVTLAELLEALRQYEGIEDVELPENFQWADHDYAQAIYWGLNEALVEDSEDDPLDPDEIVTVALLREVLENFVDYEGVDLTVTVEGEDDMIVMDLGERLVVFYGELEAAPEAKAA